MNIENLRKPQIGVMGSAADLNYSKEIERIAEETGLYIAQAGATLVFNTTEGNFGWSFAGSIAEAAFNGAKRGGGRTLRAKNLDLNKNLFVLLSRCDAVISIENLLIVFTPSPTDWTELEVDYPKTPREAVDIAMEKIMARRKAK